jgi:hypothetical protein
MKRSPAGTLFWDWTHNISLLNSIGVGESTEIS